MSSLRRCFVLLACVCWSCGSSETSRSVTPRDDAGTDSGESGGAANSGGTRSSGGSDNSGGLVGSGGAGGNAVPSGGTSPRDASADIDAGMGGAGGVAQPPSDGGTKDGAVGSDAAAPSGDVFVDSTNGVDTNDGLSAATAVKTFARAVTIAEAGRNIWVADGRYDTTTEGRTTAVTLPEGVAVRAVNEGKATIFGLTMQHRTLTGSLTGLRFDGAARLDISNATAGAAVSLTALEFVSSTAPTLYSRLSVGGQTRVTGNDLEFSGTLTTQTVSLTGSSELVLHGGTFDGSGAGIAQPGAGLIQGNQSARLTLDGVTMRNSKTTGVAVGRNSAANPMIVTLQNGTVLDGLGSGGNCGSSGGGVVVVSNTRFIMRGSRIDNSPSAGICLRSTTNSNVTLDIADSSFTNDSRGIGGELLSGAGASLFLKARNVTFTSNATGGIHVNGHGDLDIADSTFTSNGIGIFMSASTPLNVKVRGTTFTANTTGVNLGGSSAQVAIDLGTSASPGNNTFTPNTTTGVQINGEPGVSSSATGNTWTANTQGASATGKYVNGTVINGPVTTGANYRLLRASSLTL